MKRVEIKTVETIHSDYSDKEITSGGWVLTGLETGKEFHFNSLTEIALAILEKPEVFGLFPGFFHRNAPQDRIRA